MLNHRKFYSEFYSSGGFFHFFGPVGFSIQECEGIIRSPLPVRRRGKGILELIYGIANCILKLDILVSVPCFFQSSGRLEVDYIFVL